LKIESLIDLNGVTLSNLDEIFGDLVDDICLSLYPMLIDVTYVKGLILDLV
jgi:hypothetical protein